MELLRPQREDGRDALSGRYETGEQDAFSKGGTAKLKNSLFITFKLYFWRMIETSSDLHRSSSAIFDNLRRMFGQRWEIGIEKILENLGKSSESGRKSS